MEIVCGLMRVATMVPLEVGFEFEAQCDGRAV
jgi:hypothetical protein